MRTLLPTAWLIVRTAIGAFRRPLEEIDARLDLTMLSLKLTCTEAHAATAPNTQTGGTRILASHGWGVPAGLKRAGGKMVSAGSGFMIQSSFGVKGNFELVVASALGGMDHCWRDNDHPPYPWIGPRFFGSGYVDGVSLIQSTLAPTPGQLEVVVRVGDELAHYSRAATPPFTWFGPQQITPGVSGNPALIQSRFGHAGNFELVVPLPGSGLAHYWRNNDAPGRPWIGPTVFATADGHIDAVALVQSNFGSRGNLEVVARLGGELVHYWRDSGPAFTWHGPTWVFSGAAGIPGLIQSDFGTRGNFEVVTPSAAGGLAHLWRNNDAAGRTWSAATRFGGGSVGAATLIQSNFGLPNLGHLEAAAHDGQQTVLYWRDDRSPFAWTGPSAAACPEPTCDPVTEGEWRVPYSSGVVGVHAAQLHTGKVVFFTYREPDDLAHGDASVLDPESGTVTRPSLDNNLFCAGQAFLPDGRLLVAGGSSTAVHALHTFTPAGDAGGWSQIGDLADDRWYPTCTSLPDGRVLILSGTKAGGGPQVNPHSCALGKPINASYEILDPTSGLQPPRPAPVLEEAAPYSLYPFVFVLPSGKLLIHANNRTRFLDLSSWQFDPTPLMAVRATSRTYPAEGTCVLLPLLPDTDPPYRARVLLIGGGGAACPTPATATTPATNSCELLDLADSPLSWRQAAAMADPRVMPDAVLLPDGTVLVTNGSSTGVADSGINPVLRAEVYDPASDTWTSMCSMRVPRLYHSTALLLPDGRVLTAGKDEVYNPDPFKYPERRIEVFSPPYLFRGPRPSITTAPAEIAYGAPFDVETLDSPSVSAAALVRPGAVTHSFNTSQRYVGLRILQRPSRGLTLQAPPDPYVAPPGYYLLFLLNGVGVPSVGQFIRLR
jgi:hypothetical protein